MCSVFCTGNKTNMKDIGYCMTLFICRISLAKPQKLAMVDESNLGLHLPAAVSLFIARSSPAVEQRTGGPAPRPHSQERECK